jgi:hypothetical protein
MGMRACAASVREGTPDSCMRCSGCVDCQGVWADAELIGVLEESSVREGRVELTVFDHEPTGRWNYLARAEVGGLGFGPCGSHVSVMGQAMTAADARVKAEALSICADWVDQMCVMVAE